MHIMKNTDSQNENIRIILARNPDFYVCHRINNWITLNQDVWSDPPKNDQLPKSFSIYTRSFIVNIIEPFHQTIQTTHQHG